jgi:hypothetical protein
VTLSRHCLFTLAKAQLADKAAAGRRFARQPGEKRQIHEFPPKQHEG